MPITQFTFRIGRSETEVGTVSIFVVVIVVGALSNAAVLYAVTTVRCARSVASALIGNLAASDLWHCLFCLPIQLHYQLTDRWVFGAVLCRAVCDPPARARTDPKPL